MTSTENLKAAGQAMSPARSRVASSDRSTPWLVLAPEPAVRLKPPHDGFAARIGPNRSLRIEHTSRSLDFDRRTLFLLMAERLTP